MGYQEKKSYLQAILLRYVNDDRSKKSAILNEFCAVCGYNRKYAIQLLKKKPVKEKKRAGPKPVYDKPALLEPLKQIWFTADQPCGKRLKPIIKLWLPSYESTYGSLAPEIRHRLLSISPATIDRLLKPIRATNKLKGRCTTKPGSLLKSHIQIQFSHWDITRPGYVEADTVAHCGDSVAGRFAWSLTVTDIFTGWTENRAMWNKEGGSVYERISDIEKVLPFEVLGFDCDNGGEFINHALHDYFTKREKPVQFTRSRPYKKNDNAHVEQKNWTHVRNLFGYDRLDKKKTVVLMNDLYRNEWSLLQNHFMPSMKLKSKERIGAKYKKQYEPAKTPYERVLESDSVADTTKEKLQAIHAALNPFTLKKIIETKLVEIFKHIKVSSNVRQRL
ncbi:transposase family protein [Candidatus Berkiella cookevillensis]|uniref:Transposase family protein n=1 Tax=Candidatus Berkiella cookevillensis TaxID=437022 RepID=A0AAE3HQY1_9GAMM|nr:transposase family protein [Candidatus Berkiella cookevillensis]MCS5709001.1 transposase family protein [Candidatus Berkiella cookevillensis]